MPRTFDVRQTEKQLHDLRVEEWSGLALAALALSLSVAAAEIMPGLALPLFFGGFGVALLGSRAVIRRWDLCERLTLDPRAYAIPEVNARVADAASLESRASLAATIRVMLAAEPPYRRKRVDLVATELAALAQDLEDERLGLDGYYAVRCKRLLTEATESPLLNERLPADGLRATIAVIRGGFDAPARGTTL